MNAKSFKINKLQREDVPRKGMPQGNIDFPTINVCGLCYGVTGGGWGYQRGRPELTREQAFMYALMQHGYYLKSWEGLNVSNIDIVPYLCYCKCRHEFHETSRPPTPLAGLHTSKCIKCGEEITYDTSD